MVKITTMGTVNALPGTNYKELMAKNTAGGLKFTDGKNYCISTIQTIAVFVLAIG
jgi:hypothetical protein